METLRTLTDNDQLALLDTDDNTELPLPRSIRALVVGQFAGFACLWDLFDGSAYTLLVGLGAVIVLIFYPGGLAQLLRRPIRWLSFRPWRVAEHGEGVGGPVGGGSRVRP
jgi:hypothetical protein